MALPQPIDLNVKKEEDPEIAKLIDPFIQEIRKKEVVMTSLQKSITLLACSIKQLLDFNLINPITRYLKEVKEELQYLQKAKEEMAAYKEALRVCANKTAQNDLKEKINRINSHLLLIESSIRNKQNQLELCMNFSDDTFNKILYDCLDHIDQNKELMNSLDEYESDEPQKKKKKIADHVEKPLKLSYPLSKNIKQCFQINGNCITIKKAHITDTNEHRSIIDSYMLNKSLITLRIIEIKCSDEMLDHIIQNIAKNAYQFLGVKLCNFQSMIRWEKLIEYSNICTLSLHKCKIANSWKQEFGIISKNFPKLKELKLVNCGINDDCIEDLCKALLLNSNLLKLDLAMNQIKSRGYILLKQFAKSENYFLNDINLYGNPCCCIVDKQ